MDAKTKSKSAVNMFMSILAFALALWMTRNAAETLAVEKHQDGTYRIVDTRHFTISQLRWSVLVSFLTIATKFFISVVGIVTAWRLICHDDKPVHIKHGIALCLPVVSVCFFLAAEYLLFYARNNRTELENRFDANRKTFMTAMSALCYMVGLVSAGAVGLSSNLHGYC